jgi:4-hydroxy-4-methyl-2-oxoglutarate aldolase
VYTTARLAQIAGRSASVLAGPRPVFACSLEGDAVTCKCVPGDNLALHLAVAQAPQGAVIVCSAGGNSLIACFGELMAMDCRSAGIAGVVIDGAVRDVANLKEIGLPVFATSISPGAPTKSARGQVQSPITIAGSHVNPGDWIVGDADGVIAIPGSMKQAILNQIPEYEKREREIAGRLAAGERLSAILAISLS